MAAAVGTPTVGIFGPSDPRLVAPRGEKHLAIWKNVSCGPCYRPDTVVSGRDFSRCPEGTLRCMEEITIQEVQAAVRQQMDKTDGEINLTD
jgi:ADP-heptose:LPS heptosyltransferase